MDKKIGIEYERALLKSLLDREMITESEFYEALDYIATVIYGKKVIKEKVGE